MGRIPVCQTQGMARGDWAFDREEARFPHEQEVGLVGVDVDDPAQLPVVRAAARLGFEPASEAPLFCFLPAVWPDDARAWVRDIRIRHGLVSCDGKPSVRVPWSTWDYFEIEAETNALLAECGFDPRPPGRLWLLKPPPEFSSLDAVLSHLSTRADEAGLLIYAHQAFADWVCGEVERLFGKQR